jgi:hypothetical protein
LDSEKFTENFIVSQAKQFLMWERCFVSVSFIIDVISNLKIVNIPHFLLLRRKDLRAK